MGRYLRVNDLNMHYETAGRGRPLILLHGGTSTLAEWREHMPIFAQHFRVFALDSRGHGRTNNPAGRLSYRQMAGDVAGFIQAAGLQRPLVCGFSDGGQIALELGMGYPDLAAAYVVGAAWYKFSESYRHAMRAAGMPAPGVVDFAGIRAREPHTPAALQAQHSGSGDPNYWQTFLQQISHMWWTPLDYTAEDFQKIRAPCLVLMGDRDGIIPLEQALEMYRLIPQAELAILPNAEHITTQGHPAFNAIVLDFFQRQPL